MNKTSSDDNPDALSHLVVTNVAAYANENPMNLPPLADAVDPDALNNLLDSTATGVVMLTYAGFLVTITSSRTIDVQPLT